MPGWRFAIVGAIQQIFKTGPVAPQKFCRNCGLEYEVRAAWGGFSGKTGEPIKRFALCCPKACVVDAVEYGDTDCYQLPPPPRDRA